MDRLLEALGGKFCDLLMIKVTLAVALTIASWTKVN